MEQGWSQHEIHVMCHVHPRAAPGTLLRALGGGQGREWVPGLPEDSGLGSRKLGGRGRREGHRPCLPSKQPPPHSKLGTSWPGLEQEEALEVCRKTGSDCRKWVPLFSPLPRLASFRHCPPAGPAPQLPSVGT